MSRACSPEPRIDGKMPSSLKLAVRIPRMPSSRRAHPSGKSEPLAFTMASLSSGTQIAKPTGSPSTSASCISRGFVRNRSPETSPMNCARGIGVLSGTVRKASTNTSNASERSLRMLRQRMLRMASPGRSTAADWAASLGGSPRLRPSGSHSSTW